MTTPLTVPVVALGVKAGVLGAAPAPTKVTMCGLPVASSANAIEPGCGPSLLGVNVMSTLQEAPGATVSHVPETA